MAGRPKKPMEAPGGSKFAGYIAKQIDILGKKQREIAAALGYPKPNIITMFKQGLTKVPIEKVPALAKVLGLDPAHLLTLAVREYLPDTLTTIQETFGRGATVSAREYEIAEYIREITKDADPPLTKELKAKLKAAFTR